MTSKRMRCTTSIAVVQTAARTPCTSCCYGLLYRASSKNQRNITSRLQCFTP
jgi:hypothetical protein